MSYRAETRFSSSDLTPSTMSQSLYPPVTQPFFRPEPSSMVSAPLSTPLPSAVRPTPMKTYDPLQLHSTNEANPVAPAYTSDNDFPSRVSYYQLPPIVMAGTDLPSTRPGIQNDNVRSDDFHTAYHAYRNDNKHSNAHTVDYPSHQHTPPSPDSPQHDDNRHLGGRSDRGSSGYLLFCADQRSNRAADAQAPDDSILDRRWQELPQNDKKEYHRRAIIINAKVEDDSTPTSPRNTSPPLKRSFREMEQLSSRHGGQNGGRNLSYGLQHLVSPEAIRTAEQEEQEEAMGSSTRHPFSAFPSFLTMKHMHEQREETATSSQSGEEEGTEDAVIDDTPGYDNRDMPMMDHDEFAPAQSIVGLPIPAHSADQHDGPTSPSSSSSTTLLSTGPPEDEYPPWSRVGVVSRLGAAEAEALQSLGEIGGKEKVRERLKRPPNAYLLFNRDMRRKLLEISPKMTVAEISKEIGERWKLLSPEKRQEYIHEAAMIKQDHLKNHPDFIYTRRSKAQLAEARKLRKSRTEPRKKMVTKPSHSNTRRSPQPGGPRDPRGRKKKRHRHPTAPKHPMSGFLFFLAAVRPHVARQLPGSTVGPISKVIASQWRDMSEEDRLPWLQKAEEDKARYAREMRVYTSQQEAQRDLDDGSVAAVMQMVSSEQTYGYDAPDHGLMNVASSTSSSHITTSSYMYPNSAAAAHPSPPVHLSVASGVPTSNSMA